MKQFIDIHCHILPGVDDGSSSMDETIAMLTCAQRDGITAMIATPHYHLGRKVCDFDRIEQTFSKVSEEIRQCNLSLQLYLGNEIFYSDTALEDIDCNRAHTMNQTRYVLIEFHPTHSFREIRHGVHATIEAGYIPILAHAERYQALAKDIERVEELVDMGCYIQLNAADIMGNDGFHTKMFCKRLLKEDLVHFIASDAHRATGSRVPQLKKCAAYIEKKYGTEYANAIFYQNPVCVLEDKYI